MTYVIGTAFQADVLPSSFSPAHPRYARMYRVKTASLSTAFQAGHGCKIPTEFLLPLYASVFLYLKFFVLVCQHGVFKDGLRFFQ